jgi:hypothetical protein
MTTLRTGVDAKLHVFFQSGQTENFGFMARMGDL